MCVLLLFGGAARAALPSTQIESAAHALRAELTTGGAPFAIVDKRGAQLAVYDSAGRLVGVTPALLGAMPGDEAHPDAAAKLMQGGLPLRERTTPAGRYDSVPGSNLQGERVVWIDYQSGLAIHRLRPAAASQRRPERLASPSPDDNRITLGCVVVDAAFFDSVVLPLLGQTRGTVLVLPETAAQQP